MRSVSRNEFQIFRDEPVPWGQCRRCGVDLTKALTGRYRYYCGDTCRRAGNRLRRKLGYGWVLQQPWYPAWAAESKRHSEKVKREGEERRRKDEEQRKLVESMPPDVRRGYEEAKTAQFKESMRVLTETTIALDVAALNTKHADVLLAAGKVIKILTGSHTVEKLLWAAVQAENEHEADALFRKARTIAAKGLTAQDLPVMDPRDSLRQVLRAWGGGAS